MANIKFLFLKPFTLKYMCILQNFNTKCMTSIIININDGIKEPTRENQNYNTTQMLKFDGYVKVRIFVYLNYYLSQYHCKTILTVQKFCPTSNPNTNWRKALT